MNLCAAYLMICMLWLSGIHTGTSISDSLQKELQTSQGINRAEILLELSKQTRQSNVDKAIQQADEALQIAKSNHENSIICKAFNQLGYYYNLKGNNSKSYFYLHKALSLSRKMSNKKEEANVLFFLGRLYNSQEEYKNSLQYFFQSLALRTDQNNIDGAAQDLLYIGTTHLESGDVKNAIQFFQQSYDKALSNNNYRIMSMASAELGIILQEQKNFEEAIRHYNHALVAADKLNSQHAKASILLHLCSVYKDSDAYAKAIDYNRQQINIGIQSGSKIIQAQGYENLANLYQDQQMIEEAVLYYEKAKQFYIDLNAVDSELMVANQMASLYMNVNPSKSILIGEAAYDKASSNEILNRQIAILSTLISAYKKTDQFKKAFESQYNLSQLKDSSFNLKKERQISLLQTQYKVNKQKQKITLLENENEKNTILRNAGFAALFFLLLIGFLIYNRQKLKMKQNKIALENKTLKEKELKKQIHHKNKQLTTHSLHMVQKNETMKELKQNIHRIKQENAENGLYKKLNEIEHYIDYSFHLDEDWEEFRLYFEKVHVGFFKKLQQLYPDLTTNEFRLSALLKLQLTTKEISTILGIAPNSVKTARYRLRKKLNIDKGEQLSDFMVNIEKKAFQQQSH